MHAAGPTLRELSLLPHSTIARWIVSSGMSEWLDKEWSTSRLCTSLVDRRNAKVTLPPRKLEDDEIYLLILQDPSGFREMQAKKPIYVNYAKYILPESQICPDQ